jgi:hypothetical protein
MRGSRSDVALGTLKKHGIPLVARTVEQPEDDMMDDHEKTPPAPASAEDLFPDTKPAKDPAKDVREKGDRTAAIISPDRRDEMASRPPDELPPEMPENPGPGADTPDGPPFEPEPNRVPLAD